MNGCSLQQTPQLREPQLDSDAMDTHKQRLQQQAFGMCQSQRNMSPALLHASALEKSLEKGRLTHLVPGVSMSKQAGILSMWLEMVLIANRQLLNYGGE